MSSDISAYQKRQLAMGVWDSIKQLQGSGVLEALVDKHNADPKFRALVAAVNDRVDQKIKLSERI